MIARGSCLLAHFLKPPLNDTCLCPSIMVEEENIFRSEHNKNTIFSQHSTLIPAQKRKGMPAQLSHSKKILDNNYQNYLLRACYMPGTIYLFLPIFTVILQCKWFFQFYKCENTMKRLHCIMAKGAQHGQDLKPDDKGCLPACLEIILCFYNQ